MGKFIPYEKLSKKGSVTTAAGGGLREWSEWQRSARCKSASPDAASAGHRNRDQRKIDLGKRQTWVSCPPSPVSRKTAKLTTEAKPGIGSVRFHEIQFRVFLCQYSLRLLPEKLLPVHEFQRDPLRTGSAHRTGMPRHPEIRRIPVRRSVSWT